MSMKAFITGISGFTGVHLSHLLIEKGIKVTGIDLCKGEYYQADLKDKNKIKEVILKERPDYVFHLASPILRSDQLLDETLVKNMEVDLFGTVNLLGAISQLRTKPKVLITGTAAVYQKNNGRAYRESDKLEPRNAYGLSKLTQELVSLKLAQSYQVPLMISRSILLIGTHQAEGFVINDLVKQVVMIENNKQKSVLSVGNVKTQRDFLDITDGVRGYLTLIKKGKPGEIYNVCSGKGTEIKQIIDWLKINSRVKFTVKEKSQWRKNDLDVLVGDKTKLTKLGWKPKIKLEDSLSRILDYWRNTFKEKP